MNPFDFNTRAGFSTPRTRSALLGIIAPLTLLTACTTVQLPAWTPALSRPAVNTTTDPAQRRAEPAASVQTYPVVPPSITATAPAQAPAPYSPAVAARFPAPSVVYQTPGLQAGRAHFTAQNEIHDWLRDQTASLSRSAGLKAAVLPIGISQQGQPLEALFYLPLTSRKNLDDWIVLLNGEATIVGYTPVSGF